MALGHGVLFVVWTGITLYFCVNHHAIGAVGNGMVAATNLLLFINDVVSK